MELFKLKYIALASIIGLLIGIGTVFADQVTVPKAPGAGYIPMSTTTGAYVATSSPYFSNGITVSGTCIGCGASFPFTPTTNYAALTNATGTPVWFQAGLQASSTAIFSEIYVREQQQATSTAITVGFASSTSQLLRLGTSPTTVTLSSYLAQPGMTLTLTTCNPGSTAGILTFINAHYDNSGSQPGSTTDKNVCDMWHFVATQATSSLIFVLTWYTLGIH